MVARFVMLETVMLHHVSESTEVRIGPRAAYTVTPSQLESYIARRSGWKALSFGQELEAVHTGQRFLLTFDDGYYNNLTEALPVLEKYGVPCIIFVTTGFVGRQVYPYELELAHVIDSANEVYLPERDEPFQLNGRSRRQSVYEQVRRPLKRKSHERREAYMKRFAEANGYQRSDAQTERFLHWSDIRALSKHPLVTIGAHTHTHVLLSKQPWQQAYAEMKRSKELLEEVTGRHVECFSYPYGGNTLALRQMARWIGLRYGFTTQAKRIDRVRFLNRLAIPRIDINEFVKDDE